MFPRVLPLLLLGYACLGGCGRLGYQSLSPDASDAQTGSQDGALDANADVASPDAAGVDASPLDADSADAHMVDAGDDAQLPDASADAGAIGDASAIEGGIDASNDAAMALDAMLDAPSDAGDAGQDAGGLFDPPPCAVDVLWQTDFASDPTLLDDDNDSMPDWIVRGGGAFPASEIANGTWTSTSPVPLDTNPPRNIVTTAYVDVRLRSLQPPAPVTTDFEGALFWVNVDYTTTDFAPLFVSVSRTALDQQEVRFYGKSTNSVGVVLLGPVTVGPDLLHVQMEIDPTTSTMHAWIDGTLIGSVMFPRVSDVLNNDMFATAFAATSPAEYDAARIAVCVP